MHDCAAHTRLQPYDGDHVKQRRDSSWSGWLATWLPVVASMKRPDEPPGRCTLSWLACGLQRMRGWVSDELQSLALRRAGCRRQLGRPVANFTCCLPARQTLHSPRSPPWHPYGWRTLQGAITERLKIYNVQQSGIVNGARSLILALTSSPGRNRRKPDRGCSREEADATSHSLHLHTPSPRASGSQHRVLQPPGDCIEHADHRPVRLSRGGQDPQPPHGQHIPGCASPGR